MTKKNQNPKLMAADGSKSIGCYGCAQTFETVAQVEAHERVSGHGANRRRDPAAEGEAAARADLARERRER